VDVGGLHGRAVLLKVMAGWGAQKVAGDGELIGEEAAAQEVLMLEVIAINSSLERVLDVAVGTTALRVGSDRNEGGWW
jgi:hypothetical protein